MPYDPKAVANYLLDLAGAKNEPLTPMKLQKLTFFAHGWTLALTDVPLLVGGVQVWKYGPVVTSLYREFRGFGNQPITRKATDCRIGGGFDGSDLEYFEPSITTDPNGDDKLVAKSILSRIYSIYGKYDGLQLSDMTHREGTPWWIVRKKYQGEMPKNLKIPDQIIKEYFLQQLRAKTPD